MSKLSSASIKAIEDYKSGKIHWSRLTKAEKAYVATLKS